MVTYELHSKLIFLQKMKISSSSTMLRYIVTGKISYLCVYVCVCVTAWKVPGFGVFLVRIFPHLDWIRTLTRDTFHLRKHLQTENSAKDGLVSSRGSYLCKENFPRFSSLWIDKRIITICKSINWIEIEKWKKGSIFRWYTGFFYSPHVRLFWLSWFLFLVWLFSYFFKSLI